MKNQRKNDKGEGGFSLVEVIIAMVILLVALLGVFLTFTYAVNYNAGNNTRSQALSILQQEVELMRSAKFTPTKTDQGPYPIADLRGGVQTPRVITSADNNRFRVNVTVDDDPETSGVQINTATTLKEITIVVMPDSPTPGWQTAVPATVVLRRVRSN